ncbi:MAG: hypothetical protein IPF94_06300 [Betaproteobacteria bacterium]|nr:hypothetical protein [Betaproteobacteria bacterium]
MQPTREVTSTVDASVEQVLPRFGLAFVLDDASQSYGVTRSTPGSQFDALTAGRRVRLQVEAHETFSIVREFKVLD